MVFPGFDSPGLATILSSQQKIKNEKNNSNVYYVTRWYNKRTNNV